MTEVARLFVGIYSDSKNLQSGLRDAERQVNAADDRMTRTSSRMSGAMKAGFAAGGAAALEFGRRAFNSAVQFESSMANVQAVTGATDAQIAALSDQVRNIGAGSVPGVQATASAFFDISSAVADANARMVLLRQSVALAEAGQADMAVTSGALVKAFNAYGFAAGDAEFISDVYTRTVQTGIGTMDQFAAAMSSNAGIAANAKIDFEELGAAMAFITSKGQTTGAAGTQIKAVISSLLKPSQDLQRVYDELGISSITTAIETDGFIETLQRLTAEAGGSEAELAAMFGSVEALQGAMVLGGEDADDFFATYTQGLEGATAASRDAQLDNFSAQWAMLKSNIEGAGIAMVDSGGALGGLTDAMQGINLGFEFFTDPDAFTAPEIDAASFFADIPQTVTQTVDLVVEQGDTIWSLSQETGISQEDLMEGFGIDDPNDLRLGMEATFEISGTVTYTTVAGESAAQIAEKIGTTTQAVIDALPEGTNQHNIPGQLQLDIEVVTTDSADVIQQTEYAFRNLEREISAQSTRITPDMSFLNVAMVTLNATIKETTGLDVPFVDWAEDVDKFAESLGPLPDLIGAAMSALNNPAGAARDIDQAIRGGGQSGGAARADFMGLMGFSDAQRAQYGTLMGNPAEGLAGAPGLGFGFNPNFYGAGPSMGGGMQAEVDPESLENIRASLDDLFSEPRTLQVETEEAAEKVSVFDQLATSATAARTLPIALDVYLRDGGAAAALDEGISAASSLIGSYATGTDRVPQTGLYMLHEGEAVIPASQNRGGGGRPVRQTINVVLPDGRVLASTVNTVNAQDMK